MEVLRLSGRPYWSHPAFQFLTVRFSGCFHNCAWSSAAMLGFVGSHREFQGREYPAYQIFWGGRASGFQAELADFRGVVPAAWIGDFVDGFLSRLAAVLSPSAGPDELARAGNPILHVFLTEFRTPPSHDEDPLFYYDWGAGGPFSLCDRREEETPAI